MRRIVFADAVYDGTPDRDLPDYDNVSEKDAKEE